MYRGTTVGCSGWEYKGTRLGCAGGPEWGVQGGPQWGVQGARGAGGAQQGRGLAWGQARRGTRHGALEKSATLCLCGASQHAAARGETRSWLRLSPVSLHPPGTATAASHWGKTQLQSKPEEISGAAGSDPCGCSGIPALLPEERERAGRGCGQHHGNPCKGQLLMATGQQRDLGWQQMLCHEPGTPGNPGTSSWYL